MDLEKTISTPKKHPVKNAMDTNWFSYSFFTYLTPLIRLARTRALTTNDLIPLRESDSCDYVSGDFEKRWLRTFHRVNRTKADDISMDTLPNFLHKDCKSPNIVKIFGEADWKILLWSALLEAVRVAGLLAVPIVLQIFVAKLADPTVERWYLYVLVVVMFICSAISAIAQDVIVALLYRMGIHIQSSIIGGVFRKSLKLSTDSQLFATLGYIMNLCGQDTQRIAYFIPFLHMAWSCPAQVIVIFVMIGRLAGWRATLPAVGILLLTIWLLAKINNTSERLEKRKVQIADKRVKLLSEALTGIKVIKTYAWERSFAKEISRMRRSELKLIFKLTLCRSLLTVSFLVSPMLMAVSIFFTFSGTGEVLTPPIVYGTLALINLLRLPLFTFPQMLTSYAAAKISLSRIAQFYVLPEEKALTSDTSLPKGTLEMKGTFTWPFIGQKDQEKGVYDEKQWALKLREWMPPETPSAVITESSIQFLEADITTIPKLIQRIKSKKITLPPEERKLIKKAAKDEIKRSKSRTNLLSTTSSASSDPSPSPLSESKESKKVFGLTDIKLFVKPGQLIEIVGPVGSGKTSLLNAILGLMKNGEDSSVKFNGKIAYVPQRAWIRNLTFRDNILFGSPYDETRYEETLEACALSYDRKLLMNGDETEIGEKGINLSGGQKQRVSLARAVYSDADIYLLDDPLSAVDQETGRHIFYECLIPKLKQKGKTVILVTHQLQFLAPADVVVVMKDGQVTHTGKYQDVKHLDQFAGCLQVGEDKDKKKKKTTEKVQTPPKADEVSKPLSESGETQSDGKLITQEKVEEGGVPLDVYQFYLNAMGGTGFGFFLLALYMLSQGGLITADWWLTAWTAEFYPLSTGAYMGVYGALAFFGGAGAFIRVVMYARGTRIGAATIHDTLLSKFLRATMRFFDTTPYGRLLDMMSKDQQFVDTYLPWMYDGYAILLFSILGSLVLVAVITLWFFIPFVILVFLYLLYQRLNLPASRATQRLYLLTLSPILSHLAESVQGTDSIRAYGLKHLYVAENNEKVDLTNNSFYHTQLVGRWLEVRLGVLSSLVIFAAGICVINLRDQIGAALSGLALTYAVNITGQLGVMVLFASWAETFMTLVQRMKVVVDTTPEEKYEGTRTADKSWPTKPTISFKNVQLRYHADGPLILKDVSFDIPARCKLGIVGRTGAGKSTITISLFRLCELSGGSIEIDGENISNMNLLDLRSKLAIIPQDPVLFEGSVRFNLDPFNNYSDHDIWTVLERTQLKQAIMNVNGQLSGHVLPGGQNFSVGQRQLFCLARALLRRTNILIMDEATASVDPETDELVQKMIRKEFADFTVITIAHRLNTIADSDYILVLSDGKLAEFDSPKNLLSNPLSLYTKLINETAQEEKEKEAKERAQQLVETEEGAEEGTGRQDSNNKHSGEDDEDEEPDNVRLHLCLGAS